MPYFGVTSGYCIPCHVFAWTKQFKSSSAPRGAPSEDGKIIHFSQLETILAMVANNPEKIGSRTCMTSRAITSVDKKLADMNFLCGLIMISSDPLLFFLVQHPLGEGFDGTQFSADFPEALDNFNTFVALPWECNMIQDDAFFLNTVPHMEL